MSDNTLVKCSGVRKVFSGKVALDNVNLNLEKGKIIGLLGPNGSGKTTLIKILNGLILPNSGEVLIDNHGPSIYTKSIISYLPDKTYFADWMRAKDMLDLFNDFYSDFDKNKAMDMCSAMGIDAKDRIKTMSKGTKEKMQLILIMSRKSLLYLLDEPIAGVDPAARDYILTTIINNYNEEGTVLLSTHLISDIERVLDEVVFIKKGNIVLHDTVDAIREKEGKSVDAVFRDVFKMVPFTEVKSYDR